MSPSVSLSLVIPSFNRADLIVETIRSALDQTYPFAEIIIVDDASTDSTITDLLQFGDKITVIASSKIGVQRARNKGVSVAKTSYVTLCDSDDLLLPDYVEKISQWLLAHSECDSVYCNFCTFDEKKIDKDKFSAAPSGYFDGSLKEGEFLSEIPELYGKTVLFQPLFSSGVTIRKSFYESLGGYDPSFNGIGSEDWEYTLRAVQDGKTSVCLSPLVRIRRHSGNDSNNQIRMLLGEVSVMEHALRNHKEATNYRQSIRYSINKRRIEAFELAFGMKQYDKAASILASITEKTGNFKFHVKVMLAQLIGSKRFGNSANIKEGISAVPVNNSAIGPVRE